ncbi:hypothetical protein NKG05_14790 [Oerskovia sp. M15]
MAGRPGERRRRAGAPRGAAQLRAHRGEPPEPALDQVVRDASVLLGVDLEGRVREHLSTRWNGSLPPPTPVYRREVAAFVERVSHVDGLGVTGGWIAGTGLAAIVGHAQESAEQL